MQEHCGLFVCFQAQLQSLSCTFSCLFPFSPPIFFFSFQCCGGFLPAPARSGMVWIHLECLFEVLDGLWEVSQSLSRFTSTYPCLPTIRTDPQRIFCGFCGQVPSLETHGGGRTVRMVRVALRRKPGSFCELGECFFVPPVLVVFVSGGGHPRGLGGVVFAVRPPRTWLFAALLPFCKLVQPFASFLQLLPRLLERRRRFESEASGLAHELLQFRVSPERSCFHWRRRRIHLMAWKRS
eukprot:jgi/Pico_ML_1/56020/g1619.t1